MSSRRAVGGMKLTELVDGRERYPGQSALSRQQCRDSINKIHELPIVATGGSQIPLDDVASIEVVDGPNMIRTENARLNGWVYVDIRDRDLGSYVAEARQAVDREVKLPPGYSIAWSGQYQNWERAKERLWLVVPLTAGSDPAAALPQLPHPRRGHIILGTLPLGLVGGVWLMYLLGYHLSVASAIGFIALGGVAVEIGVVMLMYLDRALARREQEMPRRAPRSAPRTCGRRWSRGR